LPAKQRVSGGRRFGVLAVVLLAVTASAQTSADSLPRPDSLLRPDTTTVTPQAQPETPKPSVPLKSPGRAVLLSLLLPGGGQVYTGEWWKTLIIAPAELGLGYFTYKTHLDASAALGRGDSTVYLSLRDRRTALLWWTGAVIVFSMTDAYVSAQMYGFDREMQFTDHGGRRLRVAAGLSGLGIRMGI
jgi:hypothetical protein